MAAKFDQMPVTMAEFETIAKFKSKSFQNLYNAVGLAIALSKDNEP
jgi:hypothetical protein